jgi:uncharacterized membrane protein
LRVVQPEPEPEPVAAPAPVAPVPEEALSEETLSPGQYAHAFGLTMAAALDHAAQSGASGPESGERPPVQRPLITRAPRTRLRARPAEAGPSEDMSLEAAPRESAPPESAPPESAPAERGPVDTGPAEATVAPPASPAPSRAAAAVDPAVKPLDVMDAPLFGSIGGTAARPPRPARAPRPTSRPTPADQPDAAARTERATERTLPGTVYLLYLTGFLVVPALLGVIVALNARRGAPTWLQSHYLFQIRTFWIGCAGAAVAAALAVSSLQATEFAGLALMMLLVLWMLLRAAAGYARLLKLQVHPNPRTWLV